GDAVVIVQFARSVEAEADVEIFLGEKIAPFIIDGRAVGLNAVDDLFVVRQILLLQRYRLAKKIDAEQRRFAAVPGKTHDLPGRRLDMLLDIALQRFIVEAKIRPVGIKFFLLQIVAVVTIEVTYRPDGFYHDLKFTRRGFQKSYPRLPTRRRLVLGAPADSRTLLKKAVDVTT